MQHPIIHIISDAKFTQMVAREFEAVAPGLHKYIGVKGYGSVLPRESEVRSWLSLDELNETLAQMDYKAVVIHCLQTTSFLKYIPHAKTIAWLGWGTDYYGALLSQSFPRGLLTRRTRRLCQTSHEFLLRQVKAKLKRYREYARFANRAQLRRINYFVPVLDIEYELVRKHNPWFQSEYIEWNYGTMEDDWLGVGGGREFRKNGTIVVGNSATPENNHADVLYFLAEAVNTTSMSIICPLSYGKPWYAKRIAALGAKLFGSKFVPITQFMPVERYQETIGGSSHVFMNHCRQQAVGNVCIAMTSGAAVYLRSENPLSRWLRERGAVIRPMPHDDAEQCARSSVGELGALTNEERMHNVNCIAAHWKRSQSRKRTESLVQALLSN